MYQTIGNRNSAQQLLTSFRTWHYLEWAIDRDGRGKKASMRIAELAGCPLEPYDKLLSCVRNMNGEYLTSAYKFYQVRINFIFKMADRDSKKFCITLA
jgi:hypothetical protein